MEEQVEQFMSFTASSEPVARGFLQMSGGDVMQAVQLFFDHPELQSSIGAASSSSDSRPVQTSRRPQSTSGTDRSNAITINSDDDGDVDMALSDNGIGPGSDNDNDDDDDDPEIVAIRRAQEEEDSRLAQEMQAEMYKQGPADDDSVRAPIARTTETLVGPSYGPSGLAYSAGDGEDDELQHRLTDMERRRRNLQQQQRAHAPRGPFSQSIWEGDAPQASGSGSSRSQRLAELFRPPTDLMCHLSWEDARDEGKDQKRWLLVNLQDMSNFDCQALNRDIWKDEDIRDLLKESFIFLQYAKDDERATQYKSFYFHGQVVDNPEIYPHVSIIDPRTGEQVKVWSGRPFPSAQEFHSDLVEFLDRYSLDLQSKNPVAKTKLPPKPRNLEAMTEEEMLEIALKESMATSGEMDGNSSGGALAGGSGTSVHDPDALTRSVNNLEAEPEQEQSAFQQISAANPHVEPPQNTATTTRIQFKHPTGRVIRRFGIDEQVRRIFEWLKAEPMEGKDGVVFELKTSPQGKSLMEMLDQTIVEAGLKQGTVMVEFIEE